MKKKFITFLLVSINLIVGAQKWEVFPWVNQKNRDAGFSGGEGGQIITDIEVSQDGVLVLVTTDVGGTKISYNGGRNYEISGAGLLAEGGISIAIDPRNKNRILIVGSNHSSSNTNGVYLSKDMGKNWTQKLAAKIAGSSSYNDDQLSYDPSSYDAALDYCKIAYWSRDRYGWDLNGGTPEINPNIYKTTDGGETWNVLSGTSDYAGGNLAVNPKNGHVYAVNEKGFFVSTDGGVSWTSKSSEKCYDVSVSRSTPDTVYFCTTNGIFRSENSGESFTKIATVGSDGLVAGRSVFKISVNQVNPNKILIQSHPENGEWWDYSNYISSDGGKTWQSIKTNTTHHFYPVGTRGSPITWAPNSELIAYINVGDCVYRSTDGAVNFSWYNDGLSNVMGDYVSFSTLNPDVAILATQDYSASFTTNGGYTWKWTDPSKSSWGGNTYGSYTPDGNLVLVGHSNSWGGNVNIFVSDNGGTNFTKVVADYAGPKKAYGSPTDKNVLFYGAYRGEGPTSWKLMTGCDAVITHNPTGDKELYGRNGSSVVVSTDDGLTWKTIASAGFDINDIAYDHTNNRVYVAGQRLKGFFVMIDLNTGTKTNLISKIPVDLMGKRNISTVACDPVTPSVVYAAGWSGEYASNIGTVRSIDGGSTWKSISDGSFGQGGYEVIGIRVNAKDRNAYVATMCRGIHRFNPMYETSSIPNISPRKAIFDFEIVPNPVSARCFSLKLNSIDKANIRISDAVGKTIFTSKYSGNQINIPANVNDGVFFLSLENNGNIRTKPFVLRNK